MSIQWFITGAAGFIGSKTAEFLIESGHKVVGYDNFAAGDRDVIKRLKNKYLKSFHFIEGDIRDAELLENSIPEYAQVANLAAQASVPQSYADAAYSSEVNIKGLINVLYAANKKNSPVCLYASSSAVYGEQLEMPILETSRPDPRSPYAVSKLAGEMYAASLDEQFASMRIIGLRLFNVFGPGQKPDGEYAAVIPKWIDYMFSGKRAGVYGEGNATRDFCFVENVARLIETIQKSKEKIHHQVYNIGSGESVSLLALYAIIRDAITKRGVKDIPEQPEFLPSRMGDILHSQADIKKAAHDLGFANCVNLNQGIEKTVQARFDP